MDSTISLILAVILVGFAVTLVLLRRWLTESSKTDPLISEWLKSSTTQINQRLDFAAGLMNSVQKNLGEMAEVSKGIKSLQDFLQNPKLRGNIGEQVLSDMIGQTFPKAAFHLQYSFKSGVKADAVLKTDAGLLCIDSKFPMANFNLQFSAPNESERKQSKKDFIADVKRHISDIATKYILPAEKTLDLALMYIPSESVYYEVVNTPELTDYARSQRVYPVSPNTLYAHLQVLLVSFQGKELETKSREVFRLLRAIQKDYSKVEDGLGVLNRHLTNAYNQMSHVSSGFASLGQKLVHSNFLGDVEDKKSLPEV